jgi:hypothetical protein
VTELLEKIPLEKRWAVTAKFLIGFSILIGSKATVPLLGKEEGIIAPVLGFEKFKEIIAKVFYDVSRHIFLDTEQMFNIPVNDATEAAKLSEVVENLISGPEWKREYVEESPQRVICRITKCPWWERYKELEVDPELRPCDGAHEIQNREGLKAVNPKMTFKFTKTMPRGDLYCEEVFEFMEEKAL